MDKSGIENVREQWEQLKMFQNKVSEIAAEKIQLAEQAQRHMSQHMTRLDALHAQFEKELAKSDPEGLAEALAISSVVGASSAPAPAPPPAPARKKKQPTKCVGINETPRLVLLNLPPFMLPRFDLVGKWIAIEYDDEDQSSVVRLVTTCIDILYHSFKSNLSLCA
eukprot:SAG11_NODE_177_length_13334_cov_9.614280_15_plen_166_part_00